MCRAQGLLRHLRAAAAGQHQQQRCSAGRVQPGHQGEAVCIPNCPCASESLGALLMRCTFFCAGSHVSISLDEVDTHFSRAAAACRTFTRHFTTTVSTSQYLRRLSCLPASSCSCARSALGAPFTLCTRCSFCSRLHDAAFMRFTRQQGLQVCTAGIRGSALHPWPLACRFPHSEA